MLELLTLAHMNYCGTHPLVMGQTYLTAAQVLLNHFHPAVSSSIDKLLTAASNCFAEAV